MEYMRKHGVFEVVDEKECYDNGCSLLRLEWVDKEVTCAVRGWSVEELHFAETEYRRHVGPEERQVEMEYMRKHGVAKTVAQRLV